jgi:hypothetical protein
VDGSTARGYVARLVNNAYKVLEAAHNPTSLSQGGGLVNIGARPANHPS